MLKPELIKDLSIPLEFNRDLLFEFFPRRPTVKILIVADTSVSFTSSFGVGRVIDLIRDNVDNYVNFEVDLARLGTQSSTLSVNNSPTGHDPKYTNFRFSSQVSGNHVIDDYDQIWCFGFAPGNDGSSNDNNIWNSPYATTDADLAVLTPWMNNGGGMLAMGDHHYLGAAMCARIPRVGSMRRWTNAQGVPPIGGPPRFDTTRPDIPGSFNIGSQSDGTPQPIEWKKYPVRDFLVFRKTYRPHPVLCGGDLGVIDVLPDHAHEGHIYADTEILLNQTYSFSGVTGDEYPTSGTIQATPEVIAWANTLADPPYNFSKGETPARRFGLIGAYDGDLVDTGRVLVDSTWHHWMDINLGGLEAESPNTEFQKIARYFRNCAVWLSRKGQRTKMLNYSSFWAVIHVANFEDLNTFTPLYALGRQGIDAAGRLTSDCLVSEWINIFIDDLIWEMEWDKYLTNPKIPHPDPCWSCPPIDYIRATIYGGVIRKMAAYRDEVYMQIHEGKKPKLSPRYIDKAFKEGVELGRKEVYRSFEENLEYMSIQFERLKAFDGKKRK